MSTHLNPEITLDQTLALKTATTRLAKEFDGTFNAETIERFLHSSYDQFAGKATMVNFLPLLAERFARQRLQAMAKVEGRGADGQPVVLFLCVHNAGRSQMALASSTTTPPDARSPGREAPSPASRSMLRRWRR